MLLKSIDYSDSIHLMSSKGTVTLDCDYSFCCLTPHHASILLLTIYNVEREAEFGDSLFFSQVLPWNYVSSYVYLSVLGYRFLSFFFFSTTGYRIVKKYSPTKNKNTTRKLKPKQKPPCQVLKVSNMAVVLWPLLLPVLFHWILIFKQYHHTKAFCLQLWKVKSSSE